jgi:hypothetical protein
MSLSRTFWGKRDDTMALDCTALERISLCRRSTNLSYTRNINAVKMKIAATATVRVIGVLVL